MEFWKYGLIYEFHMSVALNISNSLLSAAELRGGITKTTEYLHMKSVVDSVELRMLRRVDCLPTQLLPIYLY